MTVGDRKFVSTAEGHRYIELLSREKRGAIYDLTCQPRYKIEIDGVTICTYVGDFRYWRSDTGEMVVEDVKGRIDKSRPVYQMYRIKRSLVRAVKGIHVVEVRVKSRRRGVYTWTVDGEPEAI